MAARVDTGSATGADHWFEACIARSKGRFHRVARERWRFEQPGRHAVHPIVSIGHAWMTVEARLPGCSTAGLDERTSWPERLLQPGQVSGATAWAVLPVGGTAALVRAERPVDRGDARDPESIMHWVDASCAELIAWPDPLSAVPSRVTSSGARAPASPVVPHAAAMLECFELAGWKARARGIDVVVALPTRDGGACHALAQVEGEALSIGFEIELLPAGDGEVAPLCRTAVAVALLRTAGSVRLVRASLRRAGVDLVAGCDVSLPLPLQSADLHQALSALAVAHRQVAFELELLAGDAALAAAYLAAQGGR